MSNGGAAVTTTLRGAEGDSGRMRVGSSSSRRTRVTTPPTMSLPRVRVTSPPQTTTRYPPILADRGEYTADAVAQTEATEMGSVSQVRTGQLLCTNALQNCFILVCCCTSVTQPPLARVSRCPVTTLCCIVHRHALLSMRVINEHTLSGWAMRAHLTSWPWRGLHTQQNQKRTFFDCTDHECQSVNPGTLNKCNTDILTRCSPSRRRFLRFTVHSDRT